MPATAATPWESVLRPRRGRVAAELEVQRRRFGLWTAARLTTFAIALVGWIPLSGFGWVAWLPVAGGLALFAGSVRRHRSVATARDLLALQLYIINESLGRAGGRVVVVRSGARPPDVPIASDLVGHLIEPGPMWALSGQECDDLDLYAAPVGLFGLLNRTSTGIGARRLRDYLENPSISPLFIQSRQVATRWLCEHAEQACMALGLLAGLRGLDQSMAAFDLAVQEARPAPGRAARLVMAILRVWTLISLVGVIAVLVALVSGDARPSVILVPLLAINAVILLRPWADARQRLARWESAAAFTFAYTLLARHMPGCLPGDAQLGRIGQALNALNHRGALAAVSRWVSWSSSGGLVRLVINLVAFYDVHVVERLERHVARSRPELRKGLAAVAELEAILSLACFSAEQPHTAWPRLADTFELSIRDGVHPLIDPTLAVPNNLALGPSGRLWIVTGSNTSGKSTFLRMAGINLVLAQIGCAVCATDMWFTPLCLTSDLRARDDLARGESYFVAEVRQLRRMIEPNAKAPVFGLIDEPFRGTNHQEQRAATLAVLEHLMRADGLFLVATHDRFITRLADGVLPSSSSQPLSSSSPSSVPTCAANYHFQEQLDDGQLSFDYRLRPGPATTCNALRVLERERYPDALVQRAMQWVERDSS